MCYGSRIQHQNKSSKAKARLTYTKNLRDRIHQANIEVHRVEVAYYELFHPEVYSKSEQKRIKSILRKIDGQIDPSRKRALDFGAGIGNITEKLLAMGYRVTAVDISAEMCAALQKKFKLHVESGKLSVVNAPVEEVDFGSDAFELISCYSVLHHLPDYETALRKLCGFLKKGGFMYLDHEASPYYWEPEPTTLADLVKSVYFHSNPMLNSVYFRLVGLNVPVVDYSLSDYWHKKEHPLKHERIERIFKNEEFASFQRIDYHSTGTWIFNPAFPIYKLLCRPEMSFWISKR
jgi:ubiquinone/menaquinone biosynthesis C-methylase UbiE